MNLGLIGTPLGHSYSQRWFERMFRRERIGDATYRLYPMASVEGIREWVSAEAMDGFNVTIPYKEEIIHYLDDMDPTARAIGAVNCVKVEQGRLTGYNTDAQAFLETLKPHLMPWHDHALILGSGGAAKAVQYALDQLGIEATMVSREPQKTKRLTRVVSYAEAAELMATHRLLVNATPVGMYPHADNSPWAYPEGWTPQHLCYDLVYNPLPTLLMRQAAEMGARTLGGLRMLCRQAELSWKIFR